MKPNEPPNEKEVLALKGVMNQFVEERLAPKLDDIDKRIAKAAAPDNEVGREKLPELESKREKLLAEYHLEAWLQNAAGRAGQIQLVTHAVKYLHQNARGSGVFLGETPIVRDSILIGSHLPDSLQASDVVGNAAALDVYKFLKLERNDKTLLELIMAGDSSMAEALSDEPEQAERLMAEFAAITGKGKPPASHKLAKQVYFPLVDGGYHLLAPLFPTSLVHAVQTRMRQDRFSEETKQARQARKKNQPNESGYRDYPGLAVQVFGGSKPQNISQLNSERHGENWLLPSFPPTWQSKPVALPLGPASIFQWKWFNRRRAVREPIQALARFLGKTDYNNVHIRRKRARLVQSMVDEILHLAALIQDMEPGWTSDERCRLNQAEALWLDPGRADLDQEFAVLLANGDWQEEVASRFANWFNSQLRAQGKRKKLPVGEAEAAEWKKVLEKELAFFRRELGHA